jgi:hypothetical protein
VRAARGVAALMLVALLAACGGSPPTRGTGQFGAADQPSSSPGASTSPGAGPSDEPAFMFSPSPEPSGSAAADRGVGDLRATYKVDKSLLGAKATVSVTLANKGTGTVDGWTVIMEITGLTLALTVPGEVKHEVRDGKHVFTPNGQGEQLRPGDSLSFAFSATGLGSVTSCTANGRDCTSA